MKPRARVVRVRGARADGSGEERRRSSAQKLLDALARGANDIEGVRKIVRVPPAPRAMVRAPGAWGDGLHWRHRAVPNVENAASRGCELTQERYGRRMRDRKSNAYMVELFETASSSSSTSLNRFDLFHAHAFAWRATNESSVVRLGILFHAKEYPAKDDENFPIDLGKCQLRLHIVFGRKRHEPTQRALVISGLLRVVGLVGHFERVLARTSYCPRASHDV